MSERTIILLRIAFVSALCFVSAHLFCYLLILFVLFLLYPHILKFLPPSVFRMAVANVTACPAYSPASKLPHHRGLLIATTLQMSTAVVYEEHARACRALQSAVAFNVHSVQHRVITCRVIRFIRAKAVSLDIPADVAYLRAT